MTYAELIQKLKEDEANEGAKVLQVDPEGNPVPGSLVRLP